MAKTNNWAPNENQRAFLQALKEFDAPTPLREINEKTGHEFKTGTINALVSKGLVEYGDDIEIEVVTTTKRKVKTYKLVGNTEEKVEDKAEDKGE